MGGNALSVVSVRLPAERYHALERDIVGRLQVGFPSKRVEAVMSFAQKVDFGDLDVLIEGGAGYDPTAIATLLKATEIVRNGDVTSIGVQIDEGVFQVDLIKTPADSFDFTARYFGFNDFGNLVGRVAHKFGAKFGHHGLFCPIRDPGNNSHLLAEVLITKDFHLALQMFGYDHVRYQEMRDQGGFQTLTDIFQYVVSSPYVNRSIYLLENRNHTARTRDAKRPTYNAFLAWLDAQPENALPAYPWTETDSPERKAEKDRFLSSAFEACPDFKVAFDGALADAARKKLVKQRFNGTLATELTGVSGKQLGELMAQVRNSFADEPEFEEFFIHGKDEDVKALYFAHIPALVQV